MKLEEVMKYFYQHIRSNKRGYQIIDKKWTIIFLGNLAILAFSMIMYIIYAGFWIVLAIFSIVLTFYVTKSIEKRLNKVRANRFPLEKKSLIEYLESRHSIHSSNTLIELLKQGNQYRDSKRKTFDYTPQLNLLIPVLIVSLTITYETNPNNNESIMAIILFIGLCSIFVNPVMNGLADVFFNNDSDRAKELSNYLQEIHFEKLIEENKVLENITKENVCEVCDLIIGDFDFPIKI